MVALGNKARTAVPSMVASSLAATKKKGWAGLVLVRNKKNSGKSGSCGVVRENYFLAGKEWLLGLSGANVTAKTYLVFP